jgi:hypothetical protein
MERPAVYSARPVATYHAFPGGRMFGLIATGIAGVSAVYLHMKSRKFVGQRLRYTTIVEKPALGLWAGVAATVVAAPVVAVLPIVAGGTAIAIGVGVGTGVALGVMDTKEPPKLIED